MLAYPLGLMGVLTTYTAGHNPIYYGSGYITRQAFWAPGSRCVFFLIVYLAIAYYGCVIWVSDEDRPVTDINPKASEFQDYRRAIRELCATFGSEYWRAIEEPPDYPEAFVKALSDAGWLAALIPVEYGGGGLSVTEASVLLEEINRSGANPARATRRCTSWVRWSATDPTSRSGDIFPRLPPAVSVCNRSRSRSRPPAPTRPRPGRWRCGAGIGSS